MIYLQIFWIRMGKTAQKNHLFAENQIQNCRNGKNLKKILVFYIEFLYNSKGQKHRTGG